MNLKEKQTETPFTRPMSFVTRLGFGDTVLALMPGIVLLIGIVILS